MLTLAVWVFVLWLTGPSILRGALALLLANDQHRLLEHERRRAKAYEHLQKRSWDKGRRK